MTGDPDQGGLKILGHIRDRTCRDNQRHWRELRVRTCKVMVLVPLHQLDDATQDAAGGGCLCGKGLDLGPQALGRSRELNEGR